MEYSWHSYPIHEMCAEPGEPGRIVWDLLTFGVFEGPTQAFEPTLATQDL